MEPIWLHLLQSTLFATLLVALYFCLPQRIAALRYTLLLAAVMKFAVPLAILVQAGRRIAELAPALARIPVPLQALPTDFLIAAPGFPLEAHPSAMPGVLGAILVVSWLLVAVGLLLLWIRRLRANALSPGEKTAVEQISLEPLLRRLPVRKQIRLYLSTTPDLYLHGIWRPIIRIPQSAIYDLTAEERDAVLLHELAHVYRRDNFWSAAAHVVVCLFWFHPMLWWLERRLTAERERACDQMVVDCGADRDAYTTGILKLCLHQIQPGIAGTSGVTSSGLKRRLELIMSHPKQSSHLHAARFVLVGAGTMMLALPLVVGFSQRSSAMPASESKGCMAGERYPEGTAVRMRSVVKECSHGSWVPTKKQPTVVIKDPEPFICQPAQSGRNDLCACQGHGIFSLGAIVQGGEQRLRCDSFTLGRFSTWRPLTAAESAPFRRK